MALEMYAFLSTRDLPTVETWQAAIDNLGYSVRLDPELDLKSSTGFSSCTLADKPSGFELAIESVAEVSRVYPKIEKIVRGYAWAVCFCWGGDLKECACVTAAIAGLVACSGAKAYYPADELWYGLDELKAGTEWRGQIDANLDTAQLILLLISPDFMDSDYCYDVE